MFLSFNFVNADTNGVWYFAEDIRGGIFGSDEIGITNFTFKNDVYFESSIYVDKIYDLEDTNYFLDLNLQSYFNNLSIQNLFVDGNVGVGILEPQERLEVNGKIIMNLETSDDDDNNTVVTKGYLENFVLDEIAKIDLSGIANDGSVLLYQEIHNGSQCMEKGGTPALAAGVQVCRIESSSCPSGWSRYENWGGTQPGTIYGCLGTTWKCTGYASYGSCGSVCSSMGTISTSSHYWGNQVELESKPYTLYNPSISGTLYASLVRVACY